MPDKDSPIDIPLRDFLSVLSKMRALTLIEHRCEQRLAALPEDSTCEAERMILQMLLRERDLDCLWLTCYQLLGDEAKVQEIKEFLHRKALRSKRH